MTLLAGLLAIGVALLAIYAIVWVRWRVRDRQRRRQRQVEREQNRGELERQVRRLHLRVSEGRSD